MSGKSIKILPAALLAFAMPFAVAMAAGAPPPAPPNYNMTGDWDLSMTLVPINSQPPTLTCVYHLQIKQKSATQYGYPPLASSNPTPPVAASPPSPAAPAYGVRISFTGAYKSDDPGMVASKAFKPANNQQLEQGLAATDAAGHNLACYHADLTGYPHNGDVGNYGYNAVFEGTAYLVTTVDQDGKIANRLGAATLSEVVPYDKSIANVPYSAGYFAIFSGAFVESNDKNFPGTIGGGWAAVHIHPQGTGPGSFILTCVAGPCLNFYK